jgi:peptidoglycan hydrolase-like protein with peptidoglycan-binding domain
VKGLRAAALACRFVAIVEQFFPTGQFAHSPRTASQSSKQRQFQPASERGERGRAQSPGTLKTENTIDLDNEGRREIVMRLKAIRFEPGRLRGKFDPNNRRAIAAWQTSRQLPTTGYFTVAQKLALETQSEEAYQLALTNPTEPTVPTRNVSRHSGGRSAEARWCGSVASWCAAETTAPASMLVTSVLRLASWAQCAAAD